MDFVIQHNLLSNDLLLAVKDAVQDLPHKFVGLIPFSREITSEEPIIGLDHIPYGSTSFVEATYELGWKGLSFDPIQFSYDTAGRNRDDMLNFQNIMSAMFTLMNFKDLLKAGVYEKTDKIFMRPAQDLKQFSGSIYEVQEAIDFLKDAMEFAGSGSYKIEPDCLIVVAGPKNILIEWRWFIVDGKVIDGSMYRRNGQLFKQNVGDDELKDGAQRMAENWLPAPCCVMDTCLLDTGEIKVVEFNCINGSGFYDHDIKKIMTEWSRYHNA